MLTRRTFLHSGSVALSTQLITPRYAKLRFGGEHAPSSKRAQADVPVRWHAGNPPDAAFMRALGERAVDAAIAAGAAYADVRLTHTLSEDYLSGSRGSLNEGCSDACGSSDLPTRGYPGEIGFGGAGSIGYRPAQITGIPTLVMGIGVRAFVHGYWGFASSPYWTIDDAARLGQEAAGQATINAKAGEPRLAELGKIPVVQQGRWVQQGVDPFTVPVNEKVDFLRMVVELTAQGDRFTGAQWGFGGSAVHLWREERVFVSSEGASYSQVRYQCTPQVLTVGYARDFEGFPGRVGTADWTPDPFQARGWESLRDLNFDDLITRLLADAAHPKADPHLETKPVTIGKYDVVFGASVTANLVYSTLGVATELDRALGFEANADGTSYLGPDPLQYLGTPVASPHVTLTANRTVPHAMATAQWDDEGVVCQDFPVVTNGILVDYQTTREQARWLAPWYEKRGMTVQSRGCAMAETALDCPIQMSPNFVLAAGSEAISVDDLIKDTARGVYLPEGWCDVDQQVRNGVIHSINTSELWRLPREIRNGRLGPALTGAGILCNSLALWKHVVALGGGATALTTVTGERKGQPSQQGVCNVTAVPMKVADCNVIDTLKRV